MHRRAFIEILAYWTSRIKGAFEKKIWTIDQFAKKSSLDRWESVWPNIQGSNRVGRKWVIRRPLHVFSHQVVEQRYVPTTQIPEHQWVKKARCWENRKPRKLGSRTPLKVG
jgi:hypothetical protein